MAITMCGTDTTCVFVPNRRRYVTSHLNVTSHVCHNQWTIYKIVTNHPSTIQKIVRNRPYILVHVYIGTFV